MTKKQKIERYVQESNGDEEVTNVMNKFMEIIRTE